MDEQNATGGGCGEGMILWAEKQPKQSYGIRKERNLKSILASVSPQGLVELLQMVLPGHEEAGNLRATELNEGLRNGFGQAQ